MQFRRIFDLPPREGNPRNSEGAFLPLQDGRVALIYSRFTGGGADDAGADLAMVALEDGAAPRILITAREENAKNLMSVSVLRMESGEIGLFYLRRQGDTVLQMFLRRSADAGETWSDPICVTPRPGFFVVNNDRVIRLSSGRILVPAAEHKKMPRTDGSVFFDARAEAVFFASDDDGKTWIELPGKGAAPYPAVCHSGLQEPGVLELKGGVLWAYARTDLGRQYQMFSRDGGHSWTPPEPSAFTSPLSPLSAKRLADGRILALYNPVPLYDGRPAAAGPCWTGGRAPLALRLSRDDGRTFSPPAMLETDDAAGYCYTAIYEKSPGHVLLAYCAGGGEDPSCLARLRVAEVELPD